MSGDSNQTTGTRRALCFMLASWSVLSAVEQILWVAEGASLWRSAIIVANAVTAWILLKALWCGHSLTWRFLFFPQWGVKQ